MSGQAMAVKIDEKKSIVAVFLAGCRRGLNMSLNSILPAVVLGYALISFLQISGAMHILGIICKPIMGAFGLPGEAAAVLIAAFFAKASGCTTAYTLYTEGVLTLGQATILFPACILMGTLVGNFARIILVTGVEKKSQQLLAIGISIFDAAIGMWLTRFVLYFLGIA